MASNKLKYRLTKKFPVLYYFYGHLRYALLVIFLLNVISVLFDGMGIAMFVPLLQIADTSVATAPDNILTRAVYSFFDFINIPVSITGMLLLMIVLFTLKAVIYYFSNVFQTVLTNTFIKDIRKNNAIGLKNLSYKEFVSCDAGILQNTMTGEANAVADSVNKYMTCLKFGMMILTYTIMAFFIDWKFSLLVFSGGILTNLFYSRFYKITKQLSQKVTSHNHDYSGLVIQSVNNFKYLKATNRSETFVRRQLKILDELVAANIRSAKIGTVMETVREPIMIAIICIVTGLHILLFKSQLTPLLVVLAMLYRSLHAVISMQICWRSFLSHSGSLENMIAFEKYLSDNRDNFTGVGETDSVKTLELRNISMKYDTVETIKNLSMAVGQLENIAIVGESGSGKTTLINIICGLLHAGSGEYLINGVSIDKLNIGKFRSKIGYITQDAAIFNTDIFNNITFWDTRNKENQDRFDKVIEICRLSEFIYSLPKGSGELLGNNGINLSGGQKQRICIARELYRDVELLLMDEATSALDAETEKEIRDNLEMLHGKLTVVTVAHRLSTIRHADKIYLLRKGEIEAAGTFEELKQKSDYFRKSAELQGL